MDHCGKLDDSYAYRLLISGKDDTDAQSFAFLLVWWVGQNCWMDGFLTFTMQSCFGAKLQGNAKYTPERVFCIVLCSSLVV